MQRRRTSPGRQRAGRTHPSHFRACVQKDVEALLEAAGLQVALLSCCVVNQSTLAIDARSPVQLVQRMERLVGTWQLRCDIEQTAQDMQAAHAKEGAARARADELEAVRLEMRPEVARLLACNAQRTALHAANVVAQEILAQRGAQLLHELRGHVRARLGLDGFAWGVREGTRRRCDVQVVCAPTLRSGCRKRRWSSPRSMQRCAPRTPRRHVRRPKRRHGAQDKPPALRRRRHARLEPRMKKRRQSRAEQVPC